MSTCVGQISPRRHRSTRDDRLRESRLGKCDGGRNWRIGNQKEDEDPKPGSRSRESHAIRGDRADPDPRPPRAVLAPANRDRGLAEPPSLQPACPNLALDRFTQLRIRVPDRSLLPQCAREHAQVRRGGGPRQHRALAPDRAWAEPDQAVPGRVPDRLLHAGGGLGGCGVAAVDHDLRSASRMAECVPHPGWADASAVAGGSGPQRSGLSWRLPSGRTLATTSSSSSPVSRVSRTTSTTRPRSMGPDRGSGSGASRYRCCNAPRCSWWCSR